MRASKGIQGCALVAILATVAIFSAGRPAAVLGDGCFVSPYAMDVWEPEQAALILYDDATQTEDLIIQATFYGDTRDFGWIVPVPSLPELESAEAQIFYDCSDLSRPVYRERGAGWGCSRREEMVFGPDGQGNGGRVDIYDDQIVGIYRALILGANDAGALTDSLQEWGFYHDGNSGDLETVLQYYIDESWFFVAMRIDSASFGDPEIGYDDYYYGRLEPVRFTFSSPQPVYPLQISSLSASYLTEVLLYVCAEHRMTFPGATTEYANRITPDELGHIKNSRLAFGALLDGPCFLTKLRARYAPEEMDEDIVLVRAPKDDEYRRIYYTGLPLAEPFMLALTWLFLSRPWRRREHRRGRS